jgi:transposase
MIVIGADVHKSTHALAAVDANTGQLLAEKEIPAKEQGHLDALRWAHELDAEIVWAIEAAAISPTTSRTRLSALASA